MWGAASFLFRCARCSCTPVWVRGSRSSRRCPYRVAVPPEGGGAPPAPGGRRAAPVAPQLRWVRGGGGGGGAAPPPALGPVWEGGGGWVGLGQGLIRTSGTTDIALLCASQLVRRVHGCPVSRPTGLMTAPVPCGGTRGREMPPCLCVWGARAAWGSVSPGAPGPGGEAGGA